MQSTLYTQKHPNVGPLERLISLVGGWALFQRGLRGKGPRVPFMAVGGYMLYRGATGRCMLYNTMGIERTGRLGRRGVVIERAITVNRPVEDVYNAWRNFTDLPRFMESLESVTVEPDGKTRWVAKPVKGIQVEWRAETTADEPNRRISWRSVLGSRIRTSGEVRFRPAPGDRGTELWVHMTFDPPGESATTAFAKVFGRDPDRQLREDLRRFKRMLETSEIATTEGQPRGPKSPQSRSLKDMMREPALLPSASRQGRAVRSKRTQEVRP